MAKQKLEMSPDERDLTERQFGYFGLSGLLHAGVLLAIFLAPTLRSADGVLTGTEAGTTVSAADASSAPEGSGAGSGLVSGSGGLASGAVAASASAPTEVMLADANDPTAVELPASASTPAPTADVAPAEASAADAAADAAVTVTVAKDAEAKPVAVAKSVDSAKAAFAPAKPAVAEVTKPVTSAKALAAKPVAAPSNKLVSKLALKPNADVVKFEPTAAPKVQDTSIDDAIANARTEDAKIKASAAGDVVVAAKKKKEIPRELAQPAAAPATEKLEAETSSSTSVTAEESSAEDEPTSTEEKATAETESPSAAESTVAEASDESTAPTEKSTDDAVPLQIALPESEALTKEQEDELQAPHAKIAKNEIPADAKPLPVVQAVHSAPTSQSSSSRLHSAPPTGTQATGLGILGRSGGSSSSNSAASSSDSAAPGQRGSAGAGGGTGFAVPLGVPVRDARSLIAMPGNEPPTYPISDRLAGHQGTSVLVGKVKADGTLENVALEKSSGSKTLDDAAAKAFKSWKYKPGQAGYIRQPMAFKLAGDVQEVPAQLRHQ